MSFKPGDTVECVKNYGTLHTLFIKGKKYQVIDFNGHIAVQDEIGQHHAANHSNLEKVFKLDDGYTTFQPTFFYDAPTPSMRMSVKSKCCDKPNIISNHACGKSFHVCRNCKKETNSEGFVI